MQVADGSTVNAAPGIENLFENYIHILRHNCCLEVGNGCLGSDKVP